MGYPMTYKRIPGRWGLHGGYAWQEEWTRDHYETATADEKLKRNIAGDLRRLEQDQRDDQHLAEYAKRAGITTAQAKAVLDALFEGDF